MKGVILAGGSGTRLHPLTRITNKHLLPLYDRPMVTYAVEALVDAGIGEMMLVTGGTHAGEFFRLLGNGHDFGIDRLLYAYQEQAGGIADALALTERFVDGDKVCVMLADNIFEDSLQPIVANFEQQAAGARVVLSQVAEDEHLRHLGVAAMEGGRVTNIVEKPDAPPSRFAVTGVYFYDAQVWSVVPTLKPSGRGELEITDVNNWYVERGDVVAQLLGHLVEVFFGAELGIHAQGVGDIVAVGTAAARLVAGRGIEVGDAQLAQVRDQVAPVHEAEAGVELQTIGGNRRSGHSDGFPKSCGGMLRARLEQFQMAWAGMRIRSGKCVRT